MEPLLTLKRRKGNRNCGFELTRQREEGGDVNVCQTTDKNDGLAK